MDMGMDAELGMDTGMETDTDTDTTDKDNNLIKQHIKLTKDKR